MPTPYDVCNGTAATGSTTLTLAVGTGAGSPGPSAAGDLIYVLLSNTSGQDVTGVTDTQGNVYTQQETSRGTQRGQLWTSLATHALTLTGNGGSPDEITGTWAATQGTKTLIARGCPGVSSATADGSNGGNGTSASPSSGATGTLTQAAELAVGGIQAAVAGGTPTGLSFGTGLTVAGLTEFDEITSATAPVTASGTITSAAWGAVVATFPLTGGQEVAGPAAALTLAAPAGSIAAFSPLPPPVIPIFPAGYDPVTADFTGWVQDTFAFLTESVVFRGHQATSQSLASGANVLTYDTIDEDPYGGWSASVTGSQAAHSWLAPWTGTYEITVFCSNTAAAIWNTAGVQITGTLYEVTSDNLMPAGKPGGAVGTFTVQLTGGVDYVQGISYTSATASTDVAVLGLQSTMEITYVSE
ncbi:MAG: hypothetical protein ACRDND_03790 [Streptosporangiaceae bacterium]